MEITKVKKIMLIILSTLIATSIVLIGYNYFRKSSAINKLHITQEMVEEVMSDEKNLIKDYSLFFTLNSAFENFTNFLLSEKYPKVYETFHKRLKRSMSSVKYTKMMRDYSEQNFFTEDMDKVYDVEDSLYKAYYFTKIPKVGNIYACKIKTLHKDKYLDVVIRLNVSGELRYEILYIGF